ncbi:MAG TPA: tetratricopeptide repeat protein [Verrucomicrobiae bacterium]|nr:tetratricopeptide repeat protein [Verrucomicrobiae bacterium]
MRRRLAFWFLLVALAAMLPFRSPAPLIYMPGEGWYYEPYGENVKWKRDRAKDQLDVAQAAFNNQDYNTALHAANRVIRVWPLSDYAPDAQYLIGRCLEAAERDEPAFNAYQAIIDKYPHSSHYEDVLWRQYAIANRFLDGQWFKLWTYIPFFPSMDKTAEMFGKIVKSGPYSDVAPHAQLRIGAAREKQGNYEDAVKAYETAADRYRNQTIIAADALYREGVCYAKQAATAEYDQGTAAQAIAAFTDFITFYPDDKRVSVAQRAIATLKIEQVRGNFEIAQFYEKNKTLNAEQRRNGAIVYYNEVLQLDPNSRYAAPARQRLEALKSQLQSSPAS